jgi:hypothetical protein
MLRLSRLYRLSRLSRLSRLYRLALCNGTHGRFSAVGLAMRLGSFCGMAKMGGHPAL